MLPEHFLRQILDNLTTAVVLLVLVLGINSLSALIAKRVGRRSQ